MKRVSLVIVLVLIFHSITLAGQPPHARPSKQAQMQETPPSAKAKAEVQKRGIGEKSSVKVKLHDKREVKGYISKIEEASFTLMDKKTGQSTTIPYAEVRKIQGPGLSRGGKILVTVIIVGGFSLLVAALVWSHTHG